MISETVVIQNKVGLHSRPATSFIQKANEYKCSVWIEKNERRVASSCEVVLPSALITAADRTKRLIRKLFLCPWFQVWSSPYTTVLSASLSTLEAK